MKISWSSALSWALLALLAHVIYVWIKNSWYFQRPLQPWDFDSIPEYVLKSAPITYYTPGKLKDVLKNWHNDTSGSYMHVYRIEPNHSNPFDFDIKRFSRLLKFKVEAYEILSYKQLR